MFVDRDLFAVEHSVAKEGGGLVPDGPIVGKEGVIAVDDEMVGGAGELLLNSMDRDGTKIGYDIELTRAIADSVPVPVIASGGVGTLDHMVEGIRDGHATAVLAASIFHFGTYTIGEAKAHMAAAGLPMWPASLRSLVVQARWAGSKGPAGSTVLAWR